AVVWVGLALRRSALRYGGMFLLALATGRLVVWRSGETLVGFTLFLNSRMAAGGFIVALLYGAAVLHHRYRDSLGATARRATPGFVAAATIFKVGALSPAHFSFS